MTMIANPNWFSVVSAAFLLGGICLAVKAALLDPTARDENGRRRLAAERKVDLSLGLPLLVIGGIFNVLATVSSLAAGGVAATLMMGLGYVLFLYVMLYELAVDRVMGEQATVSPRTPKLAVVSSAPAQLPAPEVQEVRPIAAPKEAAAQL